MKLLISLLILGLIVLGIIGLFWWELFGWDWSKPKLCSSHDVNAYIKGEMNSTGEIKRYLLGKNHTDFEYINGTYFSVRCND